MEIIIDEVKFFMNDCADGFDYLVHAYAQDPTESDQYTCEIQRILQDGSVDFVDRIYFDSCGNLEGGQNTSDPIINRALSILLSDRVHGIIRSF